jgi:hypothetical protein
LSRSRSSRRGTGLSIIKAEDLGNLDETSQAGGIREKMKYAASRILKYEGCRVADLQLAVEGLRPVPDLAEFQLTIHLFRLLRVLDRATGSSGASGR